MEVVKRDFIEDGCSAYWATDDCKLISAQTTLDLDCDDPFFEDTALFWGARSPYGAVRRFAPYVSLQALTLPTALAPNRGIGRTSFITSFITSSNTTTATTATTATTPRTGTAVALLQFCLQGN